MADPFKNDPSVPPVRRALPLALVLATGAALSVALFLMVRGSERRSLEMEFEKRSQLPAAALERDFNAYVNLLDAINAFFYSSRDVDPREFRGFTQEALRTLPGLVSLEWIPRISAPALAAHEAEARTNRHDPYPLYAVSERDAQGRRGPVASRAEYLPLYYIEPASQRGVQGLDLTLDTNATPAMARALARGHPAATAPFGWRDGTNVNWACRVFVAVYTNLVAHETPEDSRANLSGYAAALIDLNRFVTATMRSLPEENLRGLAWQLHDATVGQGGGVVLYQSERWGEARRASEGVRAQFDFEDVAGRRWELRFHPTPAYLALRRTTHGWGVLLGGLAITALFAAWLSLTLGRSAQVAKLVHQRTAELAAANRDLKAEAAERQRTEAALAAERGFIQALLDTSPDHIYFKDRESRFIRVNRSMATAFGLKNPADAVGRSDADFFTAEHAQRALADEREILRTGQPLIGREEKETWADGRTTWVSSTKQALRDVTGGIVGTFGLSRDITARKKAEQALAEQAEALRRSNEDLEQFAYVASHDLQEPLRMVASYTQLLERRYGDRLDAEAHEYIAFAVDGALRMQTLIQDLLAYSRVGTQTKAFQPVDFEEVLRRVRANLTVAIGESRAEIHAPTLPTVMGDLTQLTQLAQNLVGNAIKFRGNKPAVIHVSAALQNAPSAGNPPSTNRNPQSKEWRFSVRDEGIGIEKQYFDRIFVIFQRLHTREEYPGTGIGLAVCKKIVERHGGRIWVESEPGKGTTFFFTLLEASAKR